MNLLTVVRSAAITATSSLCVLTTVAPLGGCTAVGDVAYTSALESERERCRRLESMPERQSCLEKLRQAEAARPRP